MRTRLTGLVLAVAALAFGATASAHRATERYIPIGKSPGVSGKMTIIGTVDTMDAAKAEGALRVQSAERPLAFRCNEKTRIWLDRTSLGKTNLEGSLADCVPGRRIEVRFVNDDKAAGVAAWVKIEITEE